MNDATASHYAKQWGRESGFADFIRRSPELTCFMPAKQLGWQKLFERIRREASDKETSVYDAGCGFGLIFQDLFAAPIPARLSYLGADIHGRLDEIDNPHSRARFVHRDISEPLPANEQFDFVICRAAIHHTPDPRATFRNLVKALKPGGTIAISAYAKKAPMREAVDDALRSTITKLSPDEAMSLAKQFSALGRDLQGSQGEIVIASDLPFLGIKAGRYGIQEFIYDHLIKCWFNREYGDHSDIVNFDWYHPPYAYRYEPKDIEAWFAEEKLEIAYSTSTKAQHYFEGSAKA